jgi:hypothetical protein
MTLASCDGNSAKYAQSPFKVLPDATPLRVIRSRQSVSDKRSDVD